MAGNDTLMYAGIGAGVLYLLYKLGKPVEDTGSSIAKTTGDVSNALSPWLKDIEMIGRLPDLIGQLFAKQRELTGQEVKDKTMSAVEIAQVAKLNYEQNLKLLEQLSAAKTDWSKVKPVVQEGTLIPVNVVSSGGSGSFSVSGYSSSNKPSVLTKPSNTSTTVVSANTTSGIITAQSSTQTNSFISPWNSVPANASYVLNKAVIR